MEDLNNNEDYASVPDFFMSNLVTTKNELFPDEQSVPVFQASPAEEQPTATAGWMGTLPMNLPWVNGNVESVPSRRSLIYDPAWFIAPSAASEGANSTNYVMEGPTGGAFPDPATAPPSSVLHCPVCFRTFKQKLSLTNHQRSHMARQPHLCTICGQTFKYKTNFKRHRRHHAKEMKICRYCGTSMDSDYDLVQHEKEHRRQQKQH